MSVTLLKRDTNTGVFLWILRNCYRTPPLACSDIVLISISDSRIISVKLSKKETKKLENLKTTKSKLAFFIAPEISLCYNISKIGTIEGFIKQWLLVLIRKKRSQCK